MLKWKKLLSNENYQIDNIQFSNRNGSSVKIKKESLFNFTHDREDRSSQNKIEPNDEKFPS